MRRSLLLAFCLLALAPGVAAAGQQRELVPATAAGEFLVVRPGAAKVIVLHDRPAGAVVRRLARSTEFGGPRVLGVVERRGPWLGVTTDALPNGRLGWIDARKGLGVGVVQSSIRLSLSQRRLELLRSGRVVLRVTVAIGAASTPTPTGRFAVAEKLSGPGIPSVYGCCIIGLSAHQPRPPASWSQTRNWLVAIHGGGGFGTAISAGCVHVDDASLRRLMAEVPLGTPVFVQA
jgi:lipoprotein-anchoring transpeptidase ErfK/SrfK